MWNILGNDKWKMLLLKQLDSVLRENILINLIKHIASVKTYYTLTLKNLESIFLQHARLQENIFHGQPPGLWKRTSPDFFHTSPDFFQTIKPRFIWVFFKRHTTIDMYTVVLHRKPCICDNFWCVKCKFLHFYVQNT